MNFIPAQEYLIIFSTPNWMSVSHTHPESRGWSPNPLCDVISWWGLWDIIRFRWGDESGAPIRGLVPLKRGPRKITCPVCHVKLQWEDSHQWGGRLTPDTRSASAIILDFLISRIGKNQFLLFISSPVYGILLYLPKLRQTIFPRKPLWKSLQSSR